MMGISISSKLHLPALTGRSTDELMLLVQGGDALAFETLYCRMFPVVGGFLAARAMPWTPLDDAVQEVFCRVWEHRGRFVAGKASAQTYLLAIGLNVLRELHREDEGGALLRRNIAARVPVRDEGADGFETGDLINSCNCARSTLSDNQWNVVALIYDQELTPREASNIVGCTEKALRCRLDRARRKLREFFQLKVRMGTQKHPFHQILTRERS